MIHCRWIHNIPVLCLPRDILVHHVVHVHVHTHDVPAIQILQLDLNSSRVAFRMPIFKADPRPDLQLHTGHEHCAMSVIESVKQRLDHSAQCVRLLTPSEHVFALIVHIEHVLEIDVHNPRHPRTVGDENPGMDGSLLFQSVVPPHVLA